ncbi:putative regulator of septum formation [Haloactinopolyspora alba]|uniref:Putative regulator of septum formation n=1 Tax=Haloactinopolyspora alba TaxID=648780 RepID=A0A2P8E434_9ACTN|nr:septum formation family protein [Haloactinopolyspora alba]PSL04187.1 putative regulator of septum formation [Haloactinopolyspora alba]
MARTIRAIAAVAGAVAVFATVSCSGDDEPQRDPSGNVTETADSADVFDIKVGDCLGDVDNADEVTDVVLAPCEDEHTHEVYAIAEVPDGQFPGADAFQNRATKQCGARFAEFVGVAWKNSELDYNWLQPTEESWEQGDRQIVCLAYDPAGPVTGTLEGAGR